MSKQLFTAACQRLNDMIQNDTELRQICHTYAMTEANKLVITDTDILSEENEDTPSYNRYYNAYSELMTNALIDQARRQRNFTD